MECLGTDGPPKNASLLTSPLLFATRLGAQGNCGEAERLYKRSLAIRKKVMGLYHPHVGASLNNLAQCLDNQVIVDHLEVPDVPDLLA